MGNKKLVTYNDFVDFIKSYDLIAIVGGYNSDTYSHSHTYTETIIRFIFNETIMILEFNNIEDRDGDLILVKVTINNIYIDSTHINIINYFDNKLLLTINCGKEQVSSFDLNMNNNKKSDLI